MKVWNYFNLRTFLALVIAQVATFVAISFDIRFNLNLMLFGLAVVFPLHFSIQAAFKRRERALEYFSLFKGGLMALHFSFQISEDLPDERKTEARGLLKKMVDQLTDQLENCVPGYAAMQLHLNEIMQFIEKYRDEISKRNTLRMIRYLKDVTESSTYLVTLIKHRTMAGLRFYSTFFILIFPLVQAPILLHHLESVVPHWAIFVFTATTCVILVTLDNFQKLIEYPFDKKGMDSVQVRDFSLDI